MNPGPALNAEQAIGDRGLATSWTNCRPTPCQGFAIGRAHGFWFEAVHPAFAKLTCPLNSNRPDFSTEADQDPYVTANSPVIRFYWRYKARKGDLKRFTHKDINDPRTYDASARRQWPVNLNEDDSWGGGPFQSGTPSLWTMYRTDQGFTTDFQRLNPVTDRFLTETPPAPITCMQPGGWRT